MTDISFVKVIVLLFVLQRTRFLGVSLPLTWAPSWRWWNVPARPPCSVQPAGTRIQKSRGLKIFYLLTQATTMVVLSSYDQVGSCHCFYYPLDSFEKYLPLFLFFNFILILFKKNLGVDLSPSSLLCYFMCLHVCEAMASSRICLPLMCFAASV